jgi:hypothetical protein
MKFVRGDLTMAEVLRFENLAYRTAPEGRQEVEVDMILIA